jgi:uncharacterized sulfatase
MMSPIKILLPCVLCIPWFTQAAEKPNIIVIYTDDHGWSDLGSQGVMDDIRTPNIDALAAGGLRATDGYVTAPQCVPSRAGLLTGKYQPRFGMESNGSELDGFDAEQTIAERLKKVGYATGQVGKWHLGPTNKITDHGFDDVYSKNANRPCHANYTLDGKTIEMQQVNDGMYHLDACSDAACAFIKRHESEPFFLYLAYRAPHVPLDATKKYLARFPGEMPERRRQCLAMMSALDDGVGRVMSELRARDLEKKTLIFFMGDNGAPLKIHKHDAPGGGPGWDGSLNDPMNGEKGMLSEGGIRVPWVAYWKGKIPGGQVYSHPVISLDVAATAVALAGLPADPELDGVNVIPHFTGEIKEPPHDALFWRWIAQSAVREGKWKLLRGGSREYLFDLSNDVEEKHDVLAEHPEVAKRLSGKLEKWASGLKPPGIPKDGMSEVWERYFDFYLEGKEPPPLTKPRKAGPGPGGGWVARGGKLEIVGKALVVTPEGGKQARPFLAKPGWQVDGPAMASFGIRTQAGGKAGIQWRTDVQKDFPKEQVVEVDVAGSDDWQEVKLEVPAKGKIIHIRVRLPAGRSEVRDITLTREVR